MLEEAKRIIVFVKVSERIRFVREHYPDVLVTEPENCKHFALKNSDHGGQMLFWKWQEDDSFYLAWNCACLNAIVRL